MSCPLLSPLALTLACQARKLFSWILSSSLFTQALLLAACLCSSPTLDTLSSRQVPFPSRQPSCAEPSPSVWSPSPLFHPALCLVLLMASSCCLLLHQPLRQVDQAVHAQHGVNHLRKDLSEMIIRLLGCTIAQPSPAEPPRVAHAHLPHFPYFLNNAKQ